MAEPILPDKLGEMLEKARAEVGPAPPPVARARNIEPRKEQMYLLLASGMPPKMVAQVLGVEYSTVIQAKNSAEGRMRIAQHVTEMVKEVTQDVGQVIKASALESVNVILDIMRNGAKDSDRLHAAIEMKNTAGFKPRETVLTASYHITEEAADKIRQGLAESLGSYDELPPVADSTLALLAQAEEDERQMERNSSEGSVIDGEAA